MTITMCKKAFSVSFFLIFFLTISFGQQKRLQIFIDCNCDLSYIQQEMSYVDHVRDQEMGDVRLFINDIRAGNGGLFYNLNFMGKGDYEYLTRQLSYETNPNMTKDEIRKGLVQKISLGLLPYLMESDLADQISFTIEDTPANRATQSVTAEDPWKSWIFEIRAEGNLEKESARSNTNLEIGLEADRVTEDWRISGDVEFNHSEKRFNSGEEDIVSIRRRHFANGRMVRSLNDHWSAGAFGGVYHSTYSNINLSTYFRPAIEYSIFPYQEVLRREITLAYKIGYNNSNYIEETVYGKMSEHLFNHSLNMQMRFRQPWGDFYTNLEVSSYLHDFSKNSVELRSFASVRIFKGLSVRVSANVELIRDQLNLAAGDTSLEDLLLQQTQVATDFQANLGVGISYTFGSAFNSVVNTRL